MGLQGLAPFILSVDRPEQTASLYTLKVFAFTGTLPFTLQSLVIDQTVQDVLDAILGTRGVPRGGAALSPTEMLWTTVELRVRAHRK
jgi:hypothetical protein